MQVRRSVLALLATALWLGSACGGGEADPGTTPGATGGGNGGASGPTDAGAPSDEPCGDGPAMAFRDGIAHPDAHCGPEGCVEGGCDPIGRCQPVCNAWKLEANLAFQAVSVSEGGTPGLPEKPAKSDEDLCPEFMTTPPGVADHCCQRGDNSQAAQPALKLTALDLTRPVNFAAMAVTNTNKAAIESDRYNWVFTLDGHDDGPVVATTGNGIPLEGGEFRQMRGAFDFGGETFNTDGLWDVLEGVPGMIATEGEARILTVGPTPTDRSIFMVMWIDHTYEFPQMAMPMTGLTWRMPLTRDLNCAGLRTSRGFDTVARLDGFIRVDEASASTLYFNRTGGVNLCGLISNAKDCSRPVRDWQSQ